jgi:dynein regulatory complex protein 1
MKEEIETLSNKILAQFWELRDLGLSELKSIEEDLMAQRAQMLKKNSEYIQSLFQKHTEDENQRVIKRESAEEANFLELQKLRISMEKDYSTLKINMETEIQNCEKCYEDMKALYALNSEKLLYNYRVLTEKDKENKTLQGELKERESSFARKLRDKQMSYNNKDRTFKIKNKKFTEDYKRLSKQYKDLHKKYQHFVRADIDRYNEIKEMNQAEIEELKQKIIKCDKIVHMQQLGVVWEPHQLPQDNVGTGTTEDGKDSETINKDKEVSRDHNQTEIGQSKNESVAGRGDDITASRREPIEEDVVPEADTHAIINIVLRETEFLLDDKTIAELPLENLKELLLDKLNVLRKALAIQDSSELKKLIFTLYYQARHDQNPEEDKDGEDGEDKRDYTDEEISDLEDKYDKDKLIMVLTRFLDEKKNHVVLNTSDIQKKKQFEKEEKEKKQLAEKQYWENLTKVLPDETEQVWRVLDKIGSRYYQLLLDRHKLIEETTELHNQNDELQNLLNQYLKVNHNLINSNTQNIKVNLLE